MRASYRRDAVCMEYSYHYARKHAWVKQISYINGNLAFTYHRRIAASCGGASTKLRRRRYVLFHTNYGNLLREYHRHLKQDE